MNSCRCRSILRHLAFLPFVGILTTSCGSSTSPFDAAQYIAAKRAGIVDRASCIARKGEWLIIPERRGLCLLHLSDGGAACRDSDECQGLCVPVDQADDHGTCDDTLIPIGRFQFLKDGNVQDIHID